MPRNNFIVGEMQNKRTPNTKTWMLFDGSYKTEIYQGPIHFDDGLNNLHNINTSLFDEADADSYDGPTSRHGKNMLKHEKEKVNDRKKKGKMNRDDFDYQVPTLPFSCQIPKNIKKGYSIGQNDEFVRFIPQNVSPSKGYVNREKKNEIQYQDAWNDTDIILEVTDRGIKETMILKTDRAPFSFSFEIDGVIEDDLTMGNMKLEPAWLIDAVGEKRDVSQTIRREGDKTYIDLVADVEGLVYPIEIDPTVIIQPDATAGKDTQISEENKANNWGIGTVFNFGQDSGAYSYRSLLEFDLSAIPTNSSISNADLTLTISGGQTGSITVDLLKVTSSWTELGTTWNDQPSFDSAILSSVTSSVNSGVYVFTSLQKVFQDWINGIFPNYGFLIKGRNEDAVSNFKGAFSSDHATLSQRPKISITYNAPPTVPTVTSPNGGETWNSSHTVAWNPSTDDATAQASLQYQIQLTTDGTNWSDIVALTTAGATQYIHNFINAPQTSLAKIRIRAYDGTSYGPWDESNGVFTITHNTAPSAPTNLTPVTTKDRASVIRFAWQHNDPENDSQSRFDLDYRLQGSATWNTVTQNTINQFYDLPGNTLPKGTIEWRVRTYDQSDLSGPYSELKAFFVGDKPGKPTTLNPTDGSVVSVSNPTVEWSSVGQVGYNLKVLDATETTTLWETNQTSNNKAHTVGYSLENETDYVIQLTIKNVDGISSDIEKSHIHVSYTPPAVPILSIVGDGNLSTISLSIANPVPVNTEPVVTHHDLFRRKVGDAIWTRIANNVSLNGSYIDFTPASEQVYEYYVRAWGENGTYRDSPVVNESISLKSIWLVDPDEPESLHHFRYFEPGRTSDRVVRGQMMEFEGRSLGMAEFSAKEQQKVNVVLQLKKNSGDLEALHDLLSRHTAILYRDAKGRRIYGAIFSLSENETEYGYTVPIEVQAVSYEEGV